MAITMGGVGIGVQGSEGRAKGGTLFIATPAE